MFAPPGSNRILSGLPPNEYEAIAPHLRRIPLVPRETLLEQDEPAPIAIFPLSGVVSMVTMMEDGTSIEAAMCGNEGVVDGAVMAMSPWRALCQVPGEALTLDASLFREAMNRGGLLPTLVGRYAQSLQRLAVQTIACNRFHNIHERCARWLLMVQDRAGGNEMELSQDFLAQMLGTHRPTVTVALHSLRQAGLIELPARRHIRIIDREGMEESACECYQRVRSWSDWVFRE